MNILINLHEKVEYIFDVLKNGFEAFAVGGSIRDSILGLKCHDWDITTNAKPDDIISLFDKTIKTGLKHGTVTVMLDNEAFEVTTYRLDGEYLDGRHPLKVYFTENLKEDLSRRDFTINALAYNNDEGLKDYFNGIYDLNNKIIKCVGEPRKRFDEDALRMMRAVRFASQLGFSIETNTEEAISICRDNLKKVSIERIRDEFDKMALLDSKYINDLIKYGLLQSFVIELCNCKDVDQQNPHHVFDVLTHILKATNNIEPKLHLRLAMLYHDIGKPKCKTIDEKGIGHFHGHEQVSADMSLNILKRMKYDNNTIEKVYLLIKYHDMNIEKSKTIKKVLNQIGENLFTDLLKVKEADLLAQNPKFHKEGLEKLAIINQKFNQIIKNNECFKIKDLAIDGNVLKNIGVSEGKKIGEILKILLEEVIEKPSLNNKENLLELAKKYI